MKDQELLWKYISGECTAKEASELEKRLAQDDALTAEYHLIKATQNTLQQIPPEKPSMRFTQNVMEAIQAQAIAANALFSSAILKRLIAGLVIFSVAVYFFFYWTDGPAAANPLVLDKLNKFNDFLINLPAKTIFYLFSTVAVIILLFTADKLLGEKFLRRTTSHLPKN